jgi:hypothetical protein
LRYYVLGKFLLQIRLPSVCEPSEDPMRLDGGCLCGQIRYTVDGQPGIVSYCHCIQCRRAGGAAAVAWATFSTTELEIRSGSVSSYRSSSHAERGFCPTCGTQLFFCSTQRSLQVDVTVGSLDDPAALQPTCHVWTGSMVPWLINLTRLPQHADDGPE